MANFLLAASGEEEGKIPSAPTSEGVESCEFEYFSYVFLRCDYVFRKKIGLGNLAVFHVHWLLNHPLCLQRSLT